ncbi:6-bladed beta-propeller [Longimicrobium sp.]|uniref:6-bladed beta-propeller n=1 Tax=Longimicrobium sp. TaxID=2029185 RepID=UPI002E36B22E|nr:6-bladed beta-propeller [Longimicrobium sp.]HEX6040489.1 6-bladed beta-propeller [Longimicrobium sp.]
MLRPVRSFALQTPPSSPIVGLSGLDLAPDGSLVVTDGSDASAQLFSADGRLLKVLGRKGSGPGEFQVPLTPRFGPDGRIHVLDFRHNRISVFHPDGRVDREVPLRQLMRATGIEPERGGTYLVSGIRTAADSNTLFRVDADGRVIRGFLPIRHHAPERLRDPGMLDGLRRAVFSLSADGDTAYVALSTADSLWTLDTRSGAYRVTPVGVRGYAPPVAPRPGMLSLREVTEWGKSWTNAAAVISTGGTVAIPFVRGIHLQGDSSTVAVRRPDGTWSSLQDAPVLVRGGHGYFVGVKDPLADTLEVVLFQPRPR